MKGSPLIKHRPWKLYLGLGLVLVGSVLMFLPGFLPGAISSHSFGDQFAAAGAVVAALGLFGLLLLPTCPHCGLRLFPHAISSQNASDWLRWLLSVSTCPRCGYVRGHERDEI